ncbi:MAG: class I SAM-dependent methyltransferase [Aquificae bacterium]|nr:class I SAM-dependent methyltransferase [Aquificota bacterium]
MNTTCGCKSKFNAAFMKNLEWYLHHVYGDYKKELFSKLGKNVLEIGAGTGTNLPYYKEGTNLTVIEPSKDMLSYFLKKADKYPLNIRVKEGFAENLPFEDNSFDGVVSTLVLCSVQSPVKVVEEIRRVLKPGGVFIFIEHIKAPKEGLISKTQDILYKGWKWLFEGCDLKRETGKLIKAFFPQSEIKTVRFNSPFIPVNYHIIGYAVKTD